MKTSSLIAKHFREFHKGGNWTGTNLEETLKEVDWKVATSNLQNLNSIAALVFHINYYMEAIIGVLNGGPLNAHDKYSYDLIPIDSEEDWNKLIEIVSKNAEKLEKLMENFPDSNLTDIFSDEKHGNYYRNFHGMIEHCYYHLGQIVIIKKLLLQKLN